MIQNKLLSKIYFTAEIRKSPLQISFLDFNRENNAIVDKIRSVIPEFVTEEYPEFTRFISKYFKYPLFSKSQNIDAVRDIDITSGDFLIKLRKEFSVDSYEYEFLSDKNFLRYSKQILSKKGTIDSLKFLFYALYGEEIEVDDLQDYIFKSSTAEWSQERQINIAVRNNSITPESLVGNYVYIENEVGDVQAITVSNYEDITDRVQEKEDSTFYRLYFRDEITIPVDINNRVFNTEENFTSFIIPSIAQIKILDPGAKFRIGQIIKLDNDVGTGAIAMVSAINEDTGIRNIKILRFGDNYSSDFYLGLFPDGALATTGEAIQTTGTADINSYIKDSIDSFSERASLTITNYIQSLEGLYFDVDYVSESAVSFSTTQVYFAEVFASGLILCKMGPIQKHKGRYISQTGMPSNSSKIQDQNRYSDFQYQIKSSTDIQKYKTVVESSVHPVGFKLFGEKFVDQSASLSQNIVSQILTSTPFINGFLKSEIFSESVAQINQMVVAHNLQQNVSLTKLTSNTTASLQVS